MRRVACGDSAGDCHAGMSTAERMDSRHFFDTNRRVTMVTMLVPLLLAHLALGRRLHPIHKKEPDDDVPLPWDHARNDASDSSSEDNVYESGVLESSEEAILPSSGLQSCPGHPGLIGYSSWEALIIDVESANNNHLRTDPFLLCPQYLYNGMGTSLTISHYFTSIQCADMSRTCVVTQASIRIAEQLKNIRFEGIMFTNPSTALVVGKGTHAYFINSSISGALFNEIEQLQAPIVSFGHLFVIGSLFADNMGHGAIWAIDDTLYVDKSQFRKNQAVSFRNSAAAIHIGSDMPDAVVATTITNSCFDENLGYHVVLVEGEQATVSWATGNAVDAEAECPGITTIINATAGYCEPFDLPGTSCEALLATDSTTASQEEEDDNPEVADPLAEAAGKVNIGVSSDSLQWWCTKVVMIQVVTIAAFFL